MDYTAFQITAINSSGSSYISNTIVFGNDIIFIATDGISGEELWKYDGVSSTLLAGIDQGPKGSFIGNLRVLGNELLFFAGRHNG